MDLHKIHEVTFDTDHVIRAATLSGPDEAVLLMSSGAVIRYHTGQQKTQYLFSVKDDIGYRDGGFDMEAASTIYTLDDIVVVVNDYKTHGFIHYPHKYRALHLWREDYYAHISRYPVALYKDEAGIPHIIYGVAWNHIQIMNLDTRQVLTAAKSLITEHAEEKHIAFYKEYNEANKHPWPSPYNYFFGRLLLSPDRKRFLSAGWAWGSSDYYKLYDIDTFISSNRITDIDIGGWEHENRAVCWIDAVTVAVVYNPFTEGDDDATKDTPSEIHFYKIDVSGATIERKIPIADPGILGSALYYNKAMDALIAFSDTIGLIVLSLEGQVFLKNEHLKVNEYKVETGLLLSVENKTISINEIRNIIDH